MPFKVLYEIFDNKHDAPDFQTYDYTMAQIEWNERKRNPKGLLWRIQQTVQPEGTLSKPEEYVLLVYRVRKYTIRWRNNGMKDSDKRAVESHVRRLDDWNRRTRAYLDSYKGDPYKEPYTKEFGFFIVVEAWRDAYRERQQYQKATANANYDNRVFREMTRKIRQYEQEVDNYIKKTIKLI